MVLLSKASTSMIISYWPEGYLVDFLTVGYGTVG